MEIKLYKSGRKGWRLILLSCVFVVPAIFLLPSLGAILTISFFGLGIPLGLFNLLDSRPQIIINEIGIFDRMSIKEFINWEVIQDAYLIPIHSEVFICLVVDENYRPSKKKGKVYKMVANLNTLIGAQEININVGNVNADVTKVLELILEVVKNKSDKKGTIQKYISSNV